MFTFFSFLQLKACVYGVAVSQYYVLNVNSYQSTLKQLFGDADDGNSKDQLGVITTRILQALQSNLDGKSKQYKDPALTQLFLMNNIHYIVRSVRRYVTALIVRISCLVYQKNLEKPFCDVQVRSKGCAW